MNLSRKWAGPGVPGYSRRFCAAGQRARWLAPWYAVVTLAFVVGGGGLFAEAEWARPALVGAAIFSSAAVVLFWEGGMEMAMQKGVLELLINGALLVALWNGRLITLAN